MSAKHPKRKDRPGVDRVGRTPLHYAAVDADLGSVQRLLAAGMDPNAQDDEGWTPLHFAAQSNSVEITELLLKAGASVEACDSHGNTPLFRAVFNSRGKGDVIRLLRGSGSRGMRFFSLHSGTTSSRVGSHEIAQPDHSSEQPPRFSAWRWAAVRECLVRSTVPVGGCRSVLSLGVETMRASEQSKDVSKLLQAAGHGKLDVILDLLAQGLSVNAANHTNNVTTVVFDNPPE